MVPAEVERNGFIEGRHLGHAVIVDADGRLGRASGIRRRSSTKPPYADGVSEPSRLHRGLGLRGAVIVGLSAMLGTGVFAVWTPALALAGSLLLPALAIAAVVAALNAYSTARLAMVHPESGGAYAYGRARIGRPAGAVAGWAFVVGKSASAAAAGLTIGAYLWPDQQRLIAWIAIMLALAIDLRGVVKSMRFNAFLVAVVLAVLAMVVVLAAAVRPSGPGATLVQPTPIGVLAASGLLFVAFAGYARITVLGEEVRDPRRVIPRAMLISFGIVIALYASIGVIAVRGAAAGMSYSAAPLDDLALASGGRALASMVTIAAVLGAGSVLISLLAGIGRTLFAMAKGGDAPAGLGAVSERRIPHRAGIVAAILAAVLVSAGELVWALALSGASILLYYSVAHLAAWTLPGPGRRVVPVLGILGCVLVFGALAATAFLGGLPSR